MDAVFYSRHRTAAGRTNDRTERSRLLFVLFLSAQEKDTFRLCQRRKICAFLTEEKSTKRLTETVSRTLNLLLGSVYTRLPTVVCSRFARQANIRRAGRNCEWEVHVCGRKAAVTHLPPVRRVPPWIAYPCGTQTRAGSRRNVLSACTNDRTERSRLLFVLFFPQRKGHVSPLPKENKNVVFSPTRKRRKESLRLPPQTPIHLLGSTYPRLPTDGTAHLRALSVIRRAESVYGWKARARRRKARAV